jgi:LacI family transcriptional regulator
VKERQGASLADVARRAGVSVASASRVASGSPYPIAALTRARIEAAIAELDYRPNEVARALVTKRTRTIGVVIGAITDPYFAEIVQGVEDTASAGGYLVIVCSGQRDAAIEATFLRMLGNHNALGVIFASGIFGGAPLAAALRDATLAAFHCGVRIITVGERDLPGIPFIRVDNGETLRDMTRYLIGLGHRDIAFLRGPIGFSTAEARRKGYLEAMREAGLGDGREALGGIDRRAGRIAARVLLDEGLPSAIIGFSDESAIGALLELREAGVRVPEEVSICGVDDTRDAEVVDLTTVHVPAYELGTAAARHVMGTGQDADPSPHIVVAHWLVPRSTSAAPRIDAPGLPPAVQISEVVA